MSVKAQSPRIHGNYHCLHHKRKWQRLSQISLVKYCISERGTPLKTFEVVCIHGYNYFNLCDDLRIHKNHTRDRRLMQISDRPLKYAARCVKVRGEEGVSCTELYNAHNKWLTAVCPFRWFIDTGRTSDQQATLSPWTLSPLPWI